MASGFFAILDDISVLMDDVVTMTKAATQKTSAILGDDLAVNAEKSVGFVSNRELPVLWRITRGSFINKIIILPVAFGLSYLYKPAIIWILVLGGVFLAYEAGAKIIEYISNFLRKPAEKNEQPSYLINDPEIENQKIKSAIFTDFILSIEIILIAMSTVLEVSLIQQILVVSAVSVVATVGVYGIVALLIRMDDLGLYLLRKFGNNPIIASFGNFLIRALPIIIKFIAIIGLVALLMVSGDIFLHNVPQVHHWAEANLGFLPALLQAIFIALVIGLVVAGIKHMILSLKK